MLLGSIPSMAPYLHGFVKMSCRLKFWPPSSSYLLPLLILFHFKPAATAIVPTLLWNLCPTDANYTANSEFHTNLNLLLSSLSSSTVAATGFHNDTIGLPPNQVFGLTLCRGDLSVSDCHGCLNTSVTQITQSCPTGMSSTIWYDICMLRYSSTNFFSTADISYKVYQTNVDRASVDPQIFYDKLENLMNSLATKARSSAKLFAAGTVNATSVPSIYGLVQCTRDLYAGECYNCLLDAVGSIPSLCDGRQGCKVLGQSCNIRYETYSFYDIFYASEVAFPPLSPSPVSPPPGNEVTMTGPVFITNKCPTDASSTANGAYQSNLNLLLSYLSSTTAAAAGFYKGTTGRPPDQVYGLALCQGDLSPSVCQGCLNASVTRITQRCPKSMRSTIWFDVCMLRYSSINFFSTPDNSIEFTQINTNNASNPMLLHFQLGSLMSGLAEAARRSLKMFAVGNGNLTSFPKVYGMAQCTRDLSADDCYNCLVPAVETIAHLSSGSQGFTVLGQSCSIRYEIYPFYDISYATEVASPPPPLTGKSNSTGRRILLIVLSVNAALLLLSAIFICRRRTKATTRRRKVLPVTFDHNDQREIRDAESLSFDLETIWIATDNFSERNKLGEGGFGPVYKGTLENGEDVAVKRLSRSSGQGLDELKNEVFLLAKLRHRNLVRLLGCCLESEEKLLVYNHLANTSLDKFLFDNSKREQLDWARRFKIIEGIGRGLLYLHEDSPLKIIHRDLKASNILLDANMNPKISDFGLAKLFGGDETQGNTNRIAGTLGYMAPEYALHGLFSVKSDVYSYGVLILEIIIGQRNNGYRGSEYPIELVTHVVWRHWTQGSALQVIDQGLVEQCQAQQILRCIQIGLLCVQEDPIQRPTMANVLLMLNSHFVGLPTPSAPAYLSNRNTTSKSNDVPTKENSNGSKGILMKNSENAVSFSVLEPR